MAGQPSLIEAKIQSYIAKFLAGKETLLNLGSNPSPSVSGKAKSLMTKQTELEGELPGMLAKAKGITAGKYTWTDLYLLGNFATKLKKQIDDTARLERDSMGMPPLIRPFTGDAILGIPRQNIYFYGGLALVGFLIWKMMGARR